jgi:translocation and assembly module TamB
VAGGVLSRATLGGTLRATGLRVDAPQYGLHFTAGRLAARLAERRLIVDELVLAAGAGQFVASGSVATARKSGTAAADQITWKASRFRLFNRPDLRLVVDGEGTLVSEAGRITLAGAVRVDEGRFVHVADRSATLGEDVVVKSRSRQAAPSPRTRLLPLGVDLALDFGDRLSVAIQGLEARLAGNLRVTTGPNGFVGHGSVRTVNGTYVAFGRKLVIDPGRLIFDGPLDNPGLDIVALRKNLPVEAGVTVQGTVKVPIVRLTANVPVSDSEKLSWLVLGQGLDRASGPDLAALQGASTVLLGRDKPITATIAQRIGVDDITFRGTTGATGGSGGSRGTQETAGQVVAVGKRISDKLAVVYEQGLSTASSALKLEYALTRNVTVRAEAGIVSGVGVQYNRAFD